MSILNAAEFIRRSGQDKIKAKLQAISTGDKEAALKAIVEVGKGAGFEFTAQEYERAAREVSLVLDPDHQVPKGVEKLQAAGAGAANCTCTGCAACVACEACLACVSCLWCVVIPIGGEAVVAADAAGVISTATSLATSVSTSVASAAQGA